ncbi:MAG: glycosyltransferase family 39 protein [Stigonema ocellatum SAG 48.90 = DSM 106950]|nr:glycosyltransferase family 39 protein [Stigonema ocellatum SAG 48.90 = DSM 106950]
MKTAITQIHLQNKRIHPVGLRFFIIIAIVLGILFRFVNLDYKVYWQDEAVTSLRVSGYTWTELTEREFNGHEIGIDDLQQYQRINPEKGLVDTIRGLAIEEPQHPPLYYVIQRFWVQFFGNSVAMRRTLPALISLLVFPCLYWLCRELFQSSLTGWVAIALIAVSPFHVLYAQEAREYSLWTVTILLSSASLLQAIRLKTKFSFLIYTVTVVLSIYTFLFSGLVIIGHGIYVAITEKFKFNKTFTAYIWALTVGIIAISPWLFFIYKNHVAVRGTTFWMKEKLPLLYLVKNFWSLNLSCIFLDADNEGRILNLGFGEPLMDFIRIAIVISLAILVCYSMYFLCRNTPKRVWLFILTLIGVTALSLTLPDLIFGGRRSSVSRYLIPCYLGMQISVAHLLATKIFSEHFSQQKLWRSLMIVLISCGVLSCVISSQTQTWWTKIDGSNLPQTARIINKALHPILLAESSGLDSVNLVSLSYLLEPKVRLQLTTSQPNIFNISTGFSDVFILNPSQELLDKLKTENKIECVYTYQSKVWRSQKSLWRLI